MDFDLNGRFFWGFTCTQWVYYEVPPIRQAGVGTLVAHNHIHDVRHHAFRQGGKCLPPPLTLLFSSRSSSSLLLCVTRYDRCVARQRPRHRAQPGGECAARVLGLRRLPHRTGSHLAWQHHPLCVLLLLCCCDFSVYHCCCLLFFFSSLTSAT